MSLQALPSKSQHSVGVRSSRRIWVHLFLISKDCWSDGVEGDVPASLLSGSYKASETPQKLLVFTASASVTAPTTLDEISSF